MQSVPSTSKPFMCPPVSASSPLSNSTLHQPPQDFYTNFRRITSDPEDDLWSLSNAKKETKETEQEEHTTHKTIQSDDTSSKKSSSAKVTKNEISQPCHFIHVTNVNPNDNTLMDVFADYLQQNHSLVELDQEGRSVRLGTDQTGPILSNVT